LDVKLAMSLQSCVSWAGVSVLTALPLGTLVENVGPPPPPPQPAPNIATTATENEK
jgi:hypothetical protein